MCPKGELARDCVALLPAWTPLLRARALTRPLRLGSLPTFCRDSLATFLSYTRLFPSPTSRTRPPSSHRFPQLRDNPLTNALLVTGN